jgi:hypothetical protein
VSRSSVPTGFMGLAGNKGGVGIRFRFYETDICFVNSHFASGDGQTQRRNENYQTIESTMDFTDGPTYSFKDYFWYTTTTAGSSAPNAPHLSTSNQWLVKTEVRKLYVIGNTSFRWSTCPRNARRYVFANFALIITLKWKVVES